MHLLDLAAESVVGRVGRRHERRPEALEWEPWTIVFTLPAGMDHAAAADQVTLFADGIAASRLQVRRVDDREVDAVDQTGLL